MGAMMGSAMGAWILLWILLDLAAAVGRELPGADLVQGFPG
jgi:hypothetical protein